MTLSVVETDNDEKPFDHYFDKNINILKLCGLWIPSSSVPLGKRCIHLTFTFLIFIYLFTYQPAESSVMFINPNVSTFLRALRDQFNHFLCYYKLIIWFSYRKLIIRLMEILRDKKYYYDSYGYFETETIVQFNKKQSDRWMLLFLTFVNLICFNMCLAVCYHFIFNAEAQYIVNDEGMRVYAQQLPVNIITPFPQTTKLSFMLHFIFEIIPLDIFAWMIVGLDALFTSLMSCVSAHLGILKNAFKTIRPRCMKRLGMEPKELLHDPPELEREMQKEIKKCIEHLNMLFGVADNLERIYNLQTCAQVLTSLFEMCFCLYLLSTNINEDMGPELTYLVSTSFQLLLYCWFGNAVTEASSAIPDSIYEGDWLSSSREFKSCMLITMIRMRKRIYITIGKFTPLTFTTFLSIARVAYSFFTVLKSESI